MFSHLQTTGISSKSVFIGVRQFSWRLRENLGQIFSWNLVFILLFNCYISVPHLFFKALAVLLFSLTNFLVLSYMYTTVFHQLLDDIVYVYHSVLSTARWYHVCIPQCFINSLVILYMYTIVFYQLLDNIVYVYHSVYQLLGDIVYVYHSVLSTSRWYRICIPQCFINC